MKARSTRSSTGRSVTPTSSRSAACTPRRSTRCCSARCRSWCAAPRCASDRAMTSREILARVPLLADAREALAGLITAVEITHFGDEPANAGDYDRCRQQFHLFATAFRASNQRAQPRNRLAREPHDESVQQEHPDHRDQRRGRVARRDRRADGARRRPRRQAIGRRRRLLGVGDRAPRPGQAAREARRPGADEPLELGREGAERPARDRRADRHRRRVAREARGV